MRSTGMPDRANRPIGTGRFNSNRTGSQIDELEILLPALTVNVRGLSLPTAAELHDHRTGR